MKLNIFKRSKNDLSINKDKLSPSVSEAIDNISNSIPEQNVGNYSPINDDYNLTNPLIEIKDIHKSFGTANKQKEILKGISFDIYENQNIAILGGNGAGKTTLVELMVGLNKPTKGDIKFNYEYKSSHLEKIGIQFQDSSYPAGLSVKNIIDFVVEVFNVKSDKDEINSLIKIFGISEFYKKRATSLSGGQLQRLNALLAIIQKPKVLFLDELSTGLDISIRTRIRDFIKKFAQENNMTIVLVSHDMGEVELLCDRIIFLKDGFKVVDANKTTIINQFGSIENFVNHYINN